MASIGTYWRTLRHLKVRQFTGRLRFRLQRPVPQTGPAGARRVWGGHWAQPAARLPSLVGPTRFRYLNHEGDLAELGWVGPGAEKLWRYNQHYFDDLNAQSAASRQRWHRNLINRWLAENPPGQGDGWEPYPASLRIVNWVKAAASGLDLPPAAWQSLAVQARWLMQRLEWHLLGNHLFANAKALVFAGTAFESAEAQRWLTHGLDILHEQVPEQILPDGGQFERSPMYHALALEDMLDLINRAQATNHPALAPLLPTWHQTAARMLRWLQVMTHPNGQLAHFNDSADGIAPSNPELLRYAAELGVIARDANLTGTQHLVDSGYVRVTRGAAVALLDLAPIGPDYLPGHAHADTLSFELSLHGRPVIVNGGTSRYGNSPQRLQERGTAAHSTVQVAGQNSSEVWSGFRVGRRAYPRQVSVAPEEISAAHDGYTWLPGAPLHHRTWRWRDSALEVEDALSARATAVARFHLAPGVTARETQPQQWQLSDAQGALCLVSILHGTGQLMPSTHSPGFGVTLDTQCLTITLLQERALTRWQW